MELIVANLTTYIILILFALYTFYCFRAFSRKTQEGKNSVFATQRTLIILIFLFCQIVILFEKKEIKYFVLCFLQLAFIIGFYFIYKRIYKGHSKLVFNNMMICITIGFIMQTRLDYSIAIKQLLLATLAMVVCLFVPLFIEKFSIWERLGWQYALVGIMFLLLVFVIGVEKYGSRNWIMIGGFGVQPSEFVKVIYVFFVAALLSKTTKFKHVCIITAVAAAHILILVVEKDLGAALIYFFTYIVMLYVATGKIAYFGVGIAGGTVAAVVAYNLFSHVQTRVTAFLDPWAHINDKGYQICQSLFAIGTGGFLGMGLGQGKPTSVPVVESDFVFSAICEEMGVIFSICLILVYISSYIMFVNIAMKMQKKFYKLTAFGLSVIFIFQVFLCIGGVTKFIPSTGVTLPLISYGGSSIMVTIIMFSIIQGMYVLNEKKEVDKLERKERTREGKDDLAVRKKKESRKKVK